MKAKRPLRHSNYSGGLQTIMKVFDNRNTQEDKFCDIRYFPVSKYTLFSTILFSLKPLSNFIIIALNTVQVIGLQQSDKCKYIYMVRGL